MIKKKRLFFDIETSFNIGIFWRAGYNQSIRPDDIIHERAIICVCWKWEGEDKVYSLTWDKNQSDKNLLEEFIKVLMIHLKLEKLNLILTLINWIT